MLLKSLPANASVNAKRTDMLRMAFIIDFSFVIPYRSDRNRDSLARKARLRAANKRYEKATHAHEQAILYWSEAYRFAQCRKQCVI